MKCHREIARRIVHNMHNVHMPRVDDKDARGKKHRVNHTTGMEEQKRITQSASPGRWLPTGIDVGILYGQQ